MGAALPRPTCLEKNISDHKLLDAKGIFYKYPILVAFLGNFNFCQKMGVALPRPSG